MNMGNGWETKRRRGEGYDWVIIKLANIGLVEDIVVQTHHFKGNFPESFELLGTYAPQARLQDLTNLPAP